jgi:uncharacterized protein YbjT (DUF2867 family)
MILLTGATGRIAGAASEILVNAGVPFRAFVRNADKFDYAERDGVDVCVGDMENPDDVKRALAGISRALLVTANNERQAAIERGFSEQAAAAGVTHIVKISSMEAAADASAAFPKLHYESEEYIKSLDMAWTMIQPNFFMQNLLMYAQSIAKANLFALPLGDAQTAMIDARDVGAVCAAVMQESGHENKTYQLTGSELLTFEQVAARMSDKLGRDIRYIDQPPEEFRAFMLQIIPSAWHANAVADLFAEIAGGSLEYKTTSVKELLGREPRSVEDFLDDYPAAFAA